MRIAVLSHYFWPEPGAPSARLVELGREWVGRGHEVTIVTNFPNHPTGIVPEAYRGRSFMVEHTQGLRVIRCRTFATPNRGFAKRTLGHLMFMVQSVRQATPHLRGCDVLVASSPTLFSVAAALAISRRVGAPYVFEVRDLWPAIFVELGVIRSRAVIRALEWLELALYRRACAVVTVTRAFADDIARRGIAYCPEERGIFASLTVEENLLLPPVIAPGGMALDDIYALFPNIAERRNSQGTKLSGGEQQMLAIGRALIARPKLMLLDEPSLGLSPILVENIFSIIARINAEQGVSMLLVEQNAAVALGVAHYGYIMETGKVVIDGPATKLAADPDVREFYLGVGGAGAKSFRDLKHYKRRKRWLS